MAELDFPASPTILDEYVGTNGTTYRWDGDKWVVAAAELAGVLPHDHNDLYYTEAEVDGFITATEAYVDTEIDTHTHVIADITDFAASNVPTPALYGAVGDGTTDDTAAFATMEGAVVGFLIDLQGKKYAVDTLPVGNKYVNGKFVINKVAYPTDLTYRFDAFKITNTNRYSKWTQDKAHTFRDVIYVVYSEGEGHQDPENVILMKKSVDGGASWGAPECILRPETAMKLETTPHNDTYIICMSAGPSKDGRQVFNVTFNRGGDVTNRQHWVYHRKFPDYRNRTDLEFRTFSGSNELRITMADHGFHVGDKVRVLAADPNPINGLTIPSSELTVVSAADAWFEVECTGTASTSQSGIAAEASIWNPWGDFIKKNVTTQVLGMFPNNILYFHSWAVDENGAMWFCNGYSSVAYAVKLDNLRDTTFSYTSYGFGTSGGEGTIVSLGSGDFCGFIRGSDNESEASTTRTKFWRTTNNFTNVSFENAIPLNTQGGQVYDEPTPLTVANGKIYACRMERDDDPERIQPTDKASVKIYMFEGTIADVMANGMAGFTCNQIGYGHWTGAKTGQGGPGTGVGSMCTVPMAPDTQNLAQSDAIENYDKVYYFFGSEKETITGLYGESTFAEIYGICIYPNEMPQQAMAFGSFVRSGASDSYEEFDIDTASLNSGWSFSTGHYTTTAADFPSSDRYKTNGSIKLFRDKGGKVTMYGRLSATGAASPDVLSEHIPRRFRPSADKLFPVVANATTVASTNKVILVCFVGGQNNDSSANQGRLRFDRLTAQGLSGATLDISIDGLSWMADGDAR